MRLLILWIGLILFGKSALAGGYAGALERVLMYYAYQIDQLQPEDQRTLGFKCAKPNAKSGWDDKARRCRVGGTGKDEIKWRSCAEIMKVRRCNFAQLNQMLGDFPKTKNVVGADRDTRAPKVKDTAILFFEFMTKQPGPEGEEGKVGNFPPEHFLKDSNGVYNTMLDEVGNRVAACGQYRANNLELFAGFADASDQIFEARRGDHGTYLIDHFKEQDYIKDGTMKLAIENVGDGRSPVLDATDSTGKISRPWQTVNYENTIASSRLSEDESKHKVMATVEDYYTTDDKARDHKAVLDSYNGLASRARNC